MGWFDEQIRQREQSDQDILEDSFFRMASVVMDKWDAERLEDGRLIAKEAIDEVLKYYRRKPVDIPEDIKDVTEQLEYALRPSGLMVRDVELTEKWYSDAYGPMLGCMKDTGATVALLPGKIFGQCLRDDCHYIIKFREACEKNLNITVAPASFSCDITANPLGVVYLVDFRIDGKT